MGSLADVFVRILADDGAAQRTIKGFKTQLDRLGKETATAKVAVNTTGADAQVRALRARLASLEKTQVNIPIKTARIDTDIDLLKAKIQDLTAKTHEVKISEQGDLNKEIKKAKIELARLERQKVKIPIQLERVEAEIKHIQTQLAPLEHKKIRIPIILDMDAKAVQQTSMQLAGLLKLPALAQAASLAGAAVAQLGAGVVTLGSAIAPVVGAAGAGAGALMALGQGAGIAKFALSGVADASKAVATAQASEAAGYALTKAEIKKIAKTYGLSSDAAQEFVTQLLASDDALGKVRDGMQEEMFPGLISALKKLTNELLPIFQIEGNQTAGLLSVLADQGADMVTSGPWKDDFATVMANNTEVLSVFGAATFPLIDNFRHLAVASFPITERFAVFTRRAAALSNSFIETQRSSGGLARFFATAGDTAAQLGRVLGNVTAAVFNVGKAGYQSGKSMLDSLEGVTAKLRELSGAAAGQNALKIYFENAAKTVREVSRLAADVTAAFAKLGSNEQIAPLVAQIRTQLLPVVEKLLNSSSSFGPQLISLLTQLATTFERLTAGGGALSSFVGTLDWMARALNAVLASPLGPVVNEVLKLAGASAAVGLVAGQFMRVGAAVRIVGGPMMVFSKSLATGAVEAGSMASRLGGLARQVAVSAAQWVAETAKVVAHTAALVAKKAVQLAIARATKAWAAAQLLLNAALTANPIGLVIAGLVALGAGLVLAYKKSETFRNIVNGAFNAIKRVTGVVVEWFRAEIPAAWEWVRTKTVAAWNAVYNFLRPILRVIQGLFELYTGVWKLVITTAFKVIKNVISTVIHWVKVYISTYLAIVRKVWELAWTGIQNYIIPVFNTIRRVISTVLTFVVGYIRAELNLIAKIWGALWGAIKTVTSAVWNAIYNVVSAAFNRVRSVVVAVGARVKAVWSGIWSSVRNTATSAWNAVTSKVQQAMDKIRSIIASAKNLIGKTWSSVIDAVKGPISGLFGWINRNLIHNINGITGKFTDKLQIGDLPTFATGGVVPGYAPGRDTVAALVSPGEGWLVPEAVQGLARSMGTSPQAAIQSINSAFTSRVAPAGIGAVGVQQMWGGGVIDNILGKTKSGVKAIGRGVVNTGKVIYNAGKGAVDFGVDIFQDGVRIAAEKILGPLRDLMRRSFSGQGILVDTGVEAMVKVIDAVTNWGKDMDAGGAGGPAAPGRVGDWIRKAISFAGFPAGWAGPMQTLVMRESGGNPNAINLWDSNAKAGIPSGGLAQVIGPTFQAYRDRRLANNVFDPIANLVASMNYIKSRYGSIFNVQQAVGSKPKGYDAGGWLGPGQTGINLGSKPERVLTPRQTESFDRLVALLESGRLGNSANSGPAINATINVERRERRVGYDVADAITNLAFEHRWVGV